MRSEDKVDSLNFSLDRMPPHLCTFLRTMTCEFEFNWEKSPVNMLPLTLGNHQILREKSIYEIVSPSKEYLRHCWASWEICKGFFIFTTYALGPFVWGHPDGDLVWILFSDKSPSLFCALVRDSTAMRMKLLSLKNSFSYRKFLSPLHPYSSWRTIFGIFLNSHSHWYFLKLVVSGEVTENRYVPVFFKKNVIWHKN